MKREIFEVTAKIVDANGTLNVLDGYPKYFDSKQYGNDINKALSRAQSAFHEVVAPMYKRDDRQLQSASIIHIASGELIDKIIIGQIADIEE